MCGIAGIFRFDRQPVDERLLKKMSNCQIHRGPDDEGFYCDTKVGLSFRRLAILDLSTAGHQPMASMDRSCWLIFNGEIYNHNELRSELTKYGYIFNSSSDTEIILAAYQHWGVECLKYFNGMWSFVLWDQKKQQLFCARDRVGVKPFYYHLNSDRFLFASEIKTLFADPTTSNTPNMEAVSIYLAYGFVQFGSETFFQEIKQLPAAHYMLVDVHRIQIQRYWQLDPSNYRYDISDAEAIENFRYLFFDSVRLRLQSDVPIGTCLSGGLDSSAIVCVANQILFSDKKPTRIGFGKIQKTFSACYEDLRFDERQWIGAVIAKTGAESHQVFPSADRLFVDLETLVRQQDEPVASSSIYAQWCVMQRAHEAGVVVMLDGQGGDEVMSGYQRYYWSYLAGLLRSLQPKAFIQACKQEWGTQVTPTRTDLLGLAYMMLPISLQDQVNLWQKYRRGRKWLGDALCTPYIYRQGYSSHPTLLGQALERDLTADCLPALLKYEDRNSMAHSIEARVPFLDYRLVEFMASLPDHMKIRNGQTKWLLRQALQDLLPPEVSQRRSKLGFATPQQTWLTTYWGKVLEYLRQGESVKRGWLKADVIEAILSQPNIVDKLGENIVWRWLNIEIWARQFLT